MVSINKGLVVIYGLPLSVYQDDAFNCHLGVFSSVTLFKFYFKWYFICDFMKTNS